MRINLCIWRIRESHINASNNNTGNEGSSIIMFMLEGHSTHCVAWKKETALSTQVTNLVKNGVFNV